MGELMFHIDASELSRVMNCTGSRLLSDAPVITDNNRPAPTRDEGIAVHWIAHYIASNNGVIPPANTLAPNGMQITEEMIDHAEAYITDVITDNSRFEIDTSYRATKWAINGRADHISYSASTGVLNVDDLKYGWRLVEPDDNWTLIWHAIGYCIANNIAPSSIVLTVHQPRPYHPDGSVRGCVLSYLQLLDRYKKIDETLSNPSDMLRTGLHCHKCPKLAHCPAARSAAMNVVDVGEMAYNDDLDNDALASELDLLNRASAMIEDRIAALKNLAMYRIKDGAIVPNYTVEQSLSNRRWKNDISAEFLLAMTGVSVAKSALVTPAEAERKGIAKEFIAQCTERVPTNLKLVRVEANKKAQALLKGSTKYGN